MREGWGTPEMGCSGGTGVRARFCFWPFLSVLGVLPEPESHPHLLASFTLAAGSVGSVPPASPLQYRLWLGSAEQPPTELPVSLPAALLTASAGGCLKHR